MEINKKAFLGTWSVHEITKLLQGYDLENIHNAMDSLDSEKIDIEHFLGYSISLPHPIVVEISDSGFMSMHIIQSMRPNTPATMYIKADIKWDVNGSSMVTTPVTEKLNVRVVIDHEHGLPLDRFTELKNKITEIEASLLKDMKANPVWANKNTVALIYSGSKYFLTKSANGVFMLHHKI